MLQHLKIQYIPFTQNKRIHTCSPICPIHSLYAKQEHRRIHVALKLRHARHVCQNNVACFNRFSVLVHHQRRQSHAHVPEHIKRNQNSRRNNQDQSGTPRIFLLILFRDRPQPQLAMCESEMGKENIFQENQLLWKYLLNSHQQRRPLPEHHPIP